MPACPPPAAPRRIAVAALGAVLCSCTAFSPHAAAFASHVELSEDPDVAAMLEHSLTGFLAALRRGEFVPPYTDEAERQRHPFFYRSLARGAASARPIALKSYPNGDGSYLVTLAFVSGSTAPPTISRIVDLQATPIDGSMQFACPYDRRTAQLQQRTLGSVTFRFHSALDEDRAMRFVHVKERLERLLGNQPAALEYDCFDGLEELLKAFGLVHDASKCNFLRHDLGFLWRDGRRFTTGTGDPAYLFGYVRDLLAASAEDPSRIYGAYANGVAAYYGGYGLSGESVDELARQFRDEMRRRPDIDFLAEFRKGRRASVQRHFSHYVMCALLCREVIARCGEATALRLAACGANGEDFFAELDRLIGVTEQNFHETIVRLVEQ